MVAYGEGKRADAKGNGDGLARKPEIGGRFETHIAVVFKAQEHGGSVEEWKRRRPCPCCVSLLTVNSVSTLRT
jgi:hypothetical protein